MRRSPWIAVAIGATALIAYWLVGFPSGARSPDFVLLADAFLHGRTWIDPDTIHRPWDRIDVDGRTYLPFGPLPALVLMPLVALFGADGVSPAQPFMNAVLAAGCVVLAYRTICRFGDIALLQSLPHDAAAYRLAIPINRLDHVQQIAQFIPQCA